jgi:hypothetical protein
MEADRVLTILNAALKDKPKHLRNLVISILQIAEALYHRTNKGKLHVISAGQVTALLASGLNAQDGAGALGALDRGCELLRQGVISALIRNKWLASPKRAELSAALIRQVTELADTKPWQGAYV